jgi:hemin uptake protein HemP
MTPKTPRSSVREVIPEPERSRLRKDSRTIRRYRADELLGRCPWIVIEHGGAEYRLQVTRLGKLILTK